MGIIEAMFLAMAIFWGLYVLGSQIRLGLIEAAQQRCQGCNDQQEHQQGEETRQCRSRSSE